MSLLLRIVFVVFLISRVSVEAIVLSQDEAVILERFFRTFFEQSEGGYVVLGSKPICINGYSKKELFFGENNRHRDSVAIREAKLIFNKLPIPNNIIIHFSDCEDKLVENCYHVLFLDKGLFIKTVEKEISLFKYILGHDFNSEKLFSQLTNPNCSFHEVLKGNKVLIGILLGYQLESSLKVSRLEELQESYYQSDYPPFNGLRLHSENPFLFSMDGFLMNESEGVISKDCLKPSFGYTNIKDEINDLLSKIEISSQKLSQELPTFIFGKSRNDPFAEELVKELEGTQEKIKKLLKDENFLEKVLSLIYPNNEVSFEKSHDNILNLDKSNDNYELLASSVTKNISLLLRDKDSKFIEFFLKGLNGEVLIEKKKEALFKPANFSEAMLKACKRLQMTDKFFEKLQSNECLKCVSPNQIYYEIISKGESNTLISERYIQATYKFFVPSENGSFKLLSEGINEKIDLNNTISGFAQGINGMKINEIRRIYIHPSQAYGLFTSLPKGVHLEATVQLISILPSATSIQISPPHDLRNHYDIDFLNECDSELSEEAFFIGKKIREHYLKYSQMDFQSIVNHLILNPIQNQETSQEEEDMLNNLHWKIYFNSSKFNTI